MVVFLSLPFDDPDFCLRWCAGIKSGFSLMLGRTFECSRVPRSPMYCHKIFSEPFIVLYFSAQAPEALRQASALFASQCVHGFPR